MWHRQIPYDEQHHLASMTRHQLRQRQRKVAWHEPEKVCCALAAVGAIRIVP